MSKAAMIFSCNSRYVPLAKGLVLSLNRVGVPNADVSLHLADIGCDADERAWFEQHGVNVVRFDLNDFYTFSKDAVIKPHYGSLLCRPLLPTLFPGHEIYVHIDSDMWVQEARCISNCISIPLQMPDKVAITPCVDYSYMGETQKRRQHIDASYRIYNEIYGSEIAEEYFLKPTLSCGLFAMRGDHPIWAKWKAELDRSFDRNYSLPSEKPAAEQTCLNYLLYRDGCYVPLSATHNYQAHVGFLVRTVDDKVKVGFPPYETIGIIHLTCAELNMRTYYKYALFFDQGRYLTERDLHTLGLA